MRISVGIPVYDGKLSIHSVISLLTETHIAAMSGDFLTVRFIPSCSNLALGRNQIVKDFLESEDQRLVFLDADVTFQPGDLLKIAHSKFDFVGGAYRLKQDVENYPVLFLKDSLEPDKNNLMEVASVPTGFLSLSRNVFDTFKKSYPNREYKLDASENYCYFQIPYSGGALFTEEVFFCKEWREAGGKIYLDPEITLAHWDYNKPYAGNIGKWIKSKNQESQSEARVS